MAKPKIIEEVEETKEVVKEIKDPNVVICPECKKQDKTVNMTLRHTRANGERVFDCSKCNFWQTVSAKKEDQINFYKQLIKQLEAKGN